MGLMQYPQNVPDDTAPFCCVVSGISWKVHENSFTCVSVMLLANTDPETRQIDP